MGVVPRPTAPPFAIPYTFRHMIFSTNGNGNDDDGDDRRHRPTHPMLGVGDIPNNHDAIHRRNRVVIQ